jgi:hypothetical protein
MATARKVVRFGKAQIRHYDMILGDNPATRKGLPVTIDWAYYDPIVQLLYDDDVDETRTSRQRRPVRLKTDYRRTYLSSLGMYSAADFVYVLVEIQKIQESRRENAGQENVARFGDFFETSAGFFLRSGSAVMNTSVGAVNVVLKSSKVIGDSSTLVVKEAVTGIRRGSQVAVDAAVSVGKATGNMVGKVSRQGSQLAVGSIVSAGSVAKRGSMVAANTAVNAGKATSSVAITAGKATTQVAMNAGKATSQVAKATTSAASEVARTTAKAVNVAVRTPIDMTKNVLTGIRGPQGDISRHPAMSEDVARSLTPPRNTRRSIGMPKRGAIRSLTPPKSNVSASTSRALYPSPKTGASSPVSVAVNSSHLSNNAESPERNCGMSKRAGCSPSTDMDVTVRDPTEPTNNYFAI